MNIDIGERNGNNVISKKEAQEPEKEDKTGKCTSPVFAAAAAARCADALVPVLLRRLLQLLEGA